MRIVFLSRSLAGGGAERQFLVLAAGIAAKGHYVSIVVFFPPRHGDELPPGVKIISLGKRADGTSQRLFVRLFLTIRTERPDIQHPYLPTANCVAALVRPFVPHTKLVFGMRASDMRTSQYEWLERAMYWLEARFASCADLLIANSDAGRRHAAAQGYPAERIVVIPNGIDTVEFAPSPAAGRYLRESRASRPANF